MGRAFEYRKASKMARWDRMAKAFTRVGREIAIAVKAGGPLAETNPSLRRAIQNAKGVNMPKDRVEAAIKKASSKDSEAYDEVAYEGYGPYGIAIVVETATNNTTRTVANLRNIFTKNDGTLGNSGSVSFMFDRKGVFKFPLNGKDAEELEFQLIDIGLDSIEIENDIVTAYSKFEDFGTFSKGLDELGIEATSQELHRIPNATKELNEEQTDEILELIDKLEQDDDVQSVYHTLA
ncbi:MAG: YebC/PmpR family DNA-binding transcriptional regulator [Bacteroidota bacterium]